MHVAARGATSYAIPSDGRLSRAGIPITEKPHQGETLCNSRAVMSKDQAKKSFRVGSRGKMPSLCESSHLPFCSRTGSVKRADMRKTRLRPAVYKYASLCAATQCRHIETTEGLLRIQLTGTPASQGDAYKMQADGASSPWCLYEKPIGTYMHAVPLMVHIWIPSVRRTHHAR